jgi:hypothetical protein
MIVASRMRRKNILRFRVYFRRSAPFFYWTSQHKLKIVAALSCGEASKEADFQLMVGALFTLNTRYKE